MEDSLKGATSVGPPGSECSRVDEQRGGSEAADSKPKGFSQQQARVLSAFREGNNVFFTGPAGTGKSFLLTTIIQELRDKYGDMFPNKVAVTALTGIAATHINGITLHSALGLGIIRQPSDFSRLWKHQNKRKIRSLDVIIIDEISMLSAEMLEHLNQMVTNIRYYTTHQAGSEGPRLPFGGIQLVLCGDFHQLPPIEDHKSPKGTFRNRGFAFEAPCWEYLQLQSFILDISFRQSDSHFAKLLDDIRRGPITGQNALRNIKQRCDREISELNSVKPTRLFPRNRDVDQLNQSELDNLPSAEFHFHAQDDVYPLVGLDKDPPLFHHQESLLRQQGFFRDCLAKEDVVLKRDSQVMLVKNIDLRADGVRMLVNGSRGRVRGFARTRDIVMQWMERKEGAQNDPDDFVDLRSDHDDDGQGEMVQGPQEEDDGLPQQTDVEVTQAAKPDVGFVRDERPEEEDEPSKRRKMEHGEPSERNAQGGGTFEQKANPASCAHDDDGVNPEDIVESPPQVPMEKVAALRSWGGKFVPVVDFANQRTEVICPEVFECEYPQIGKCVR